MAENYPAYSPYNYYLQNPINYIYPNRKIKNHIDLSAKRNKYKSIKRKLIV